MARTPWASTSIRQARGTSSPRPRATILREVPPGICTAGLFVNESRQHVTSVLRSCRSPESTGLTAVQFHGDEDRRFCTRWPLKVIKAFRVRDEETIGRIGEYPVDYYLLDSCEPGVRRLGVRVHLEVAAGADGASRDPCGRPRCRERQRGGARGQALRRRRLHRRRGRAGPQGPPANEGIHRRSQGGMTVGRVSNVTVILVDTVGSSSYHWTPPYWNRGCFRRTKNMTGGQANELARTTLPLIPKSAMAGPALRVREFWSPPSSTIWRQVWIQVKSPRAILRLQESPCRQRCVTPAELAKERCTTKF